MLGEVCLLGQLGTPDVNYTNTSAGVGSYTSAGVSSNTSAGVGSNTSAGVGSNTSAGVGSNTSAGVGSNTSAGVGSNTSAGVGSNTSAGVGSNTSAGVGSNTSAGVGSNTSAGVGSNTSAGVGSPSCHDHAVVLRLPIVLQAPGSAPKPEAYDEVHESQLFKHVGPGRGLRTQVHSDGAPCWPKIVKGMKKNSVRSFHVNTMKWSLSKR